MYKVLIAEDEEIIRKGLVYTIPWQEIGCTVVAEAGNGKEGIEKIRSCSPDIIIVDINMPVADGLEMLKETYKDFDYSAIILSGYSSFEYARQAIAYGVSGYLLKPLNRSELKEEVERAKERLARKKLYRTSEMQRKELREISLLRDYNNSGGGYDEVVNGMLSFISENYSQKILMRDVVKTLNYSETFLNKRFKEAVGTTFIEYLNRYRIQKAVQMLQEQDCTVQDAAWKCGIGDYKYFGIVFKKYIGCSPKEYLSRIKN